ncbi:MAG TPA: MerR family transcriptional regulator [Frankiaceae bacterium]|jgi:transposase-like protein|nr:MerR family transcriptional regulator [Frankiaceae bacterium]
MSEPGLTVAAVARRLGVAPSTLRTWERRYGLGPNGREAGARRFYTPSDLAVLDRMRRLTLEGVAPSVAARVAVEGHLPDATPPTELEFRTPARTGQRARGLSRAALALDCDSARALLADSIARDGVIATWDGLIAPVLRAVGERWGATGEGVEVEHCLSEAAVSVLNAVAPFAAPPPRPVLLTCVDGELHSLPLHALRAALAERNVASRMLGAALPPAALAAAVRRTGPAALVAYAHQPEHAVVGLLDAVPATRPATTVIAGGAGWPREALPGGVQYVHDLGEAVHLVLVATGQG